MERLLAAHDGRPRRLFTALGAFLLAVNCALTGQDTPWRVVDSRPIAPPGPPHVETWLTVDPTDATRMLASGIVAGPNDTEVFRTQDGGTTWSKIQGPWTNGTFPGYDPVVLFGQGGQAWIATLSFEPSKRRELSRNFNLWHSRDAGVNWKRLNEVPGGIYDRSFLALGPGTPEPVLHAVGKTGLAVFDAPLSQFRQAVSLTSSENGGESFSAPRLFMPDPDSEVLFASTGLHVTPRRRILIPFISQYLPNGPLPAVVDGSLKVVILDEGGAQAVSVADVAMFSRAASPVQEKLGLSVGDIAQGPASGSVEGPIYLAGSTLRGNLYRVFVVASFDGGSSWTNPAWVAPDSSPGDQVNVTLAVNAEGVLAISWNDFRRDPDHVCYDLLFTTTVDGKTFGEPLRVSDAPTCAAASYVGSQLRTKVDTESPTFRWVNGGDTQGMEALPDGSFVLAWPSGTNGPPRLWLTRVQQR